MSGRLPDEAYAVPCPRCKALRRLGPSNLARSFVPHPAHVTSGRGPYFVTGVLCESIVLGVGRVIKGGKA